MPKAVFQGHFRQAAKHRISVLLKSKWTSQVSIRMKRGAHFRVAFVFPFPTYGTVRFGSALVNIRLSIRTEAPAILDRSCWRCQKPLDVATPCIRYFTLQFLRFLSNFHPKMSKRQNNEPSDGPISLPGHH